MPYGVSDNIWKHLSPDERTAVEHSWRAAQNRKPAPTPTPAPKPAATETIGGVPVAQAVRIATAATPHPVQPIPAPSSKSARTAPDAPDRGIGGVTIAHVRRIAANYELPSSVRQSPPPAEPSAALAQLAHRHGDVGAATHRPTLRPTQARRARGDASSGLHSGGGFFAAVEKYVIHPLEEGAPYALPYAGAAIVTALCPECTVAAALAAGATRFGVEKGVEHESTDSALLGAALEAVGHFGGEAAQRALIKQVDHLLVEGEVSQASNVMLAALLQSRYESAQAFHHP